MEYVTLGVDRPLPAAAPPLPGSISRTSFVDIVWLPAPGVEADPETALVLRAAAQDVAVAGDGTARVIAGAALTVWLDRRMVTRRLSVDPPVPGVVGLVGLPSGRGFRAAARQVVGAGARGPLAQLLDDVPVAALISGYATLRSGGLSAGIARDPSTVLAMRDLCSGWRDGGTMMASIDRGEGVPVPALAVAPDIDRPDDPLSGDPLLPLPAGSLRRRRRIDILPAADGVTRLTATFRDTYADAGVGEGILHEYALTASVDTEGRLSELTADARVLPWPECPAAAVAVEGLVGTSLAGLGAAIPDGTASCTHLNDLLRSVAGVAHLIAARPPT